MKADIHPRYVETSVTCGCGNKFTTRSTKPTIQVEICSHCHPFYTGKQKFVDTAGRVEKFQRKYAWTDGKPVPAGAAAPATPAAPGEKAGEKGKPRTLEATSLKQFAARSKHAPSPVAPPPKDAKPANEPKAVAEEKKAPKAEKPAEPKAEKAEKAAEAKAEKPAEPKAEKAPEAPAAEKPAEAKAEKPAEPKAEKPAGEQKPKGEKKPKGDKKPKPAKAEGGEAKPAEKPAETPAEAPKAEGGEKPASA